MNLLSALITLKQHPKPAALCTVVSSQGSTPRKAGAKMLVLLDNSCSQIIGTIGGGAIEHRIKAMALEVIHNNQPRLVKTSLRNDLAMCCGGEMTVFIEPLRTQERFLCFGAGHISQALCPLMHSLGFQIFVFDSRSELLATDIFDNFSRSTDVSAFSFASMPWGAESFAVVATHDHQLDQEIIENILKYEFKYLALVGSIRKAHMTRKRLDAKNICSNLSSRVVCPAGIDIYAQSPQEIAVSIAAQIIQVKYGPAQALCSDRSSGTEPTYGISQSPHVSARLSGSNSTHQTILPCSS